MRRKKFPQKDNPLILDSSVEESQRFVIANRLEIVKLD